MKSITLHDIEFNISDELEITPELMDRLEKAAVWKIKRPIAIMARRDPKPQYRYSYQYATPDQIEANPKSIPVTFGGIETCILLPDDPPVEIDENDIRIAKEIWAENAYVAPWPYGGEPDIYIDFD